MFAALTSRLGLRAGCGALAAWAVVCGSVLAPHSTWAHDAPGEYFFDADPGIGLATPVPLSGSPPTLNDLSSLSLPLPNTPHAATILGLRFRNPAGQWGPTLHRRLYLLVPASPPVVEAAWGDTFQPPTAGIPAAESSLTLSRPFSTFGDPRPDRLSLRVRSGDFPGPFVFRQVHSFSALKPTRVYYAIDSPPSPAAAPFLALAEAHRLAATPIAIPLGELVPGFHTLHLLIEDTSGNFSTAQRFLQITPSSTLPLTSLAYTFRSSSGANSLLNVVPLLPASTPQDLALPLPPTFAVGAYSLVLQLADASAERGFSTVSALSLGSSFDLWAVTALAGRAPNASGPLDDPDGDRLVNLIEFAFGLDPLAPELSAPYLIEPMRDGTQFLFRYRQRNGGTGALGVDYTAAGLRYRIEASNDLQTWSPSAALVGSPVALYTYPNGDGTETVHALLNASGSLTSKQRIFFRLNISLAP